MGSQSFNSNDLDSPGFEYLRSHRAMNTLYFKLVALDYQREFCPLYKCPPVHRFYFTIPSANQVEQQFSFIYLCVWLIKDKCQMNFDTEPHEYQDLDSSVNVIFEALKLLLSSDEHHQIDERHLFPVGRLKQGYGPEVIYCLNRFADRALEMALEDNPRIGQVEIVYHDKQKGGRDRVQPTNSIVIGQPIVGGGLTTRPLGNYKIDDASLMLDYQSDATLDKDETDSNETHTAIEWDEEKLSKIEQLFEIDYEDGNSAQLASWQELLESVKRSRREFEDFLRESKPCLETIAKLIEHEMQIINGRESTLNVNLKAQIEQFSAVWREHREQSQMNADLSERINQKTDTFDLYVQQLKELRSKEISPDDEGELEHLKRLTRTLDRQRREMDLKLTLLLAAPCRTGSSKR